VREVNAIINGMLMLARPDQLELKAVNVDQLLKEVVESTKRVKESTGIEAEISFRPNARGVWITGDELKLKQAFLNVVHNALEALTQEGKRKVRISSRRVRGGSGIQVLVTDTGRGIPPESAEKLFRPFFTTRERGSGLGLSVAAKFVDLHGGHLSARSLPGRATVFKIDLNGCLTAERTGVEDD
jgi:signal transduction histidine kinase